jgi:hypothetical protein
MQFSDYKNLLEEIEKDYGLLVGNLPRGDVDIVDRILTNVKLIYESQRGEIS